MFIGRSGTQRALLAIFICGAGCGGSGGEATGGVAFRAQWGRASGQSAECRTPVPPGGFNEMLPAVQWIQITVDGDASGCCIEVDRMIAMDARSLRIDGLNAGAATIQIRGYPSDATNNVDLDLCNARAASAQGGPGLGRRCDGAAVAFPSYRSDEHPVFIAPGPATNAGDIEIPSVPFVVLEPDGELLPQPGATTNNRTVRVVVADAICGVRAEPIILTVGGQPISGATSTPCDDGGDTPCSTSNLDVTGQVVSGTMPAGVASGTLELAIAAQQDLGPASENMSYSFTWSGLPTPSPTLTPTSTPTPTQTPTITPTPTFDIGFEPLQYFSLSETSVNDVLVANADGDTALEVVAATSAGVFYFEPAAVQPGVGLDIGLLIGGNSLRIAAGLLTDDLTPDFVALRGVGEDPLTPTVLLRGAFARREIDLEASDFGFQTAMILESEGTRVFIAGYNIDGETGDLLASAVASWGASTLTSAPERHTLEADGLILAIAGGDLGSDERADFVSIQQVGNDVLLLLHTSSNDGRYTTHSQDSALLARGPGVMAIGDLDRDGVSEVVLETNEPPGIQILQIINGTTLAERAFAPVDDGCCFEDLMLVDLNADEKLDAVLSDAELQQIHVLIGDGTGRLIPIAASPIATVDPEQEESYQPFQLATGDVNGDSVIDLVATTDDAVIVLVGERR